MTPEQIEQLPYRPCVGVMLANPRGHIFVGQRIDQNTPAWQMPQGGVDAGERTQDAAFRELEEETGVSPKLITLEAESTSLIRYDFPAEKQASIWKGRYRGQEQKWYLMRFHGTAEDINIATKHPEFSAWQWMKKEDLVDAIVPFKQAVYQQVLKDFAGKI